MPIPRETLLSLLYDAKYLLYYIPQPDVSTYTAHGSAENLRLSQGINFAEQCKTHAITDVQNSDFNEIEFVPYCTFSNLDLTGSHFSGAIVIEAQFIKTSMRKAVLRPALNRTSSTQKSTRFESCLFDQTDFTDAILEGNAPAEACADPLCVSFVNCQFIGVDFSKCKINQYTEFRGCRFDQQSIKSLSGLTVNLSEADLSAPATRLTDKEKAALVRSNKPIAKLDLREIDISNWIIYKTNFGEVKVDRKGLIFIIDFCHRCAEFDQHEDTQAIQTNHNPPSNTASTLIPNHTSAEDKRYIPTEKSDKRNNTPKENYRPLTSKLDLTWLDLSGIALLINLKQAIFINAIIDKFCFFSLIGSIRRKQVNLDGAILKIDDVSTIPLYKLTLKGMVIPKETFKALFPLLHGGTIDTGCILEDCILDCPSIPDVIACPEIVNPIFARRSFCQHLQAIHEQREQVIPAENLTIRPCPLNNIDVAIISHVIPDQYIQRLSALRYSFRGCCIYNNSLDVIKQFTQLYTEALNSPPNAAVIQCAGMKLILRMGGEANHTFENNPLRTLANALPNTHFLNSTHLLCYFDKINEETKEKRLRVCLQTAADLKLSCFFIMLPNDLRDLDLSHFSWIKQFVPNTRLNHVTIRSILEKVNEGCISLETCDLTYVDFDQIDLHGVIIKSPFFSDFLPGNPGGKSFASLVAKLQAGSVKVYSPKLERLKLQHLDMSGTEEALNLQNSIINASHLPAALLPQILTLDAEKKIDLDNCEIDYDGNYALDELVAKFPHYNPNSKRIKIYPTNNKADAALKKAFPPKQENWKGTQYVSEKFQSLKFDGINIDQCTCAFVTFNNCDFVRTRIIGINANTPIFRDCSFVNCIFDQTTFTNALFSQCKFINCTFRNTLFSGMILMKSIKISASLFSHDDLTIDVFNGLLMSTGRKNRDACTLELANVRFICNANSLINNSTIDLIDGLASCTYEYSGSDEPNWVTLIKKKQQNAIAPGSAPITYIAPQHVTLKGQRYIVLQPPKQRAVPPPPPPIAAKGPTAIKFDHSSPAEATKNSGSLNPTLPAPVHMTLKRKKHLQAIPPILSGSTVNPEQIAIPVKSARNLQSIPTRQMEDVAPTIQTEQAIQSTSIILTEQAIHARAMADEVAIESSSQYLQLTEHQQAKQQKQPDQFTESQQTAQQIPTALPIALAPRSSALSKKEDKDEIEIMSQPNSPNQVPTSLTPINVDDKKRELDTASENEDEIPPQKREKKLPPNQSTLPPGTTMYQPPRDLLKPGPAFTRIAKEPTRRKPTGGR